MNSTKNFTGVTKRRSTIGHQIFFSFHVWRIRAYRFSSKCGAPCRFCSLEQEKSTDYFIDFTHFRTNIVGMNTFNHFFPIHILSPITEMQCTYIYNSFVHSFAPLSSHTTSYFSLMVFRSFSIIFRYPSLSSFSLSSPLLC